MEIWAYRGDGAERLLDDRAAIQLVSSGGVRLEGLGYAVELSLAECLHIAELIGVGLPGAWPRGGDE